MLKILLALFADWLAYRRAISGGPSQGFGHVSVWPVDDKAELTSPHVARR